MNYIFGWETTDDVDDTKKRRSDIEEANNVIGELLRSQEFLAAELAKSRDDLNKALDEVARLKYANRLQTARCRSSLVSLRGALGSLESAASLGLPPDDENNGLGTPLASSRFIERARVQSDDETGSYVSSSASCQAVSSVVGEMADAEAYKRRAEDEADRAAEGIRDLNEDWPHKETPGG